MWEYFDFVPCARKKMGFAASSIFNPTNFKLIVLNVFHYRACARACGKTVLVNNSQGIKAWRCTLQHGGEHVASYSSYSGYDFNLP